MEEKTRSWLFRKRTVLAAALVAGVIVGQYLPNFWNGFGGGSSVGVGIGDPAPAIKGEPSDDPTAKPVEDEIKPLTNVPPVIKVVIDERSYFIRSTEGDRPVKIADVIALAKAAKGDRDGIRVRVYRRRDSRMSAAHDLQDAFVKAGISDSEVLWVPGAFD